MKNKDNKKIRVGISVGDTNGVGIELILKTFSDDKMLKLCTPIVFGSKKLISMQRELLDINNVDVYDTDTLKNPIANKLNIYNISNDNISIDFGNPTQVSGHFAALSFQKAVSALKETEEIDVLVTCPMNKESSYAKTFKHLGHTQYLNEQFQGNALMFMLSDNLKVALLTHHIPLSEVSSKITEELITMTVKTIKQSLEYDFGIQKPKIAVLGLNPHAGDNGIIGKEDAHIIKPTITKLYNSNTLVYGPYPSDGFFGNHAYLNFDAVLAMYHDQGLIPFKMYSFFRGVNYTAGLSVVRTSPNHGTAYDIAGKGIANPSSFKIAILKAIDIYTSRKKKISTDDINLT